MSKNNRHKFRDHMGQIICMYKGTCNNTEFRRNHYQQLRTHFRMTHREPPSYEALTYSRTTCFVGLKRAMSIYGSILCDPDKPTQVVARYAGSGHILVHRSLPESADWYSPQLRSDQAFIPGD